MTGAQLTTAVDAIAAALLHFLWQGTALAALLWTLEVAAHRLSARARYRLACGTLAGMAAVFAFTVFDGGTGAARVSGAGVSPGVSPEPGVSWSLVVVALWATGAAMLSLRLVGGLVALGRLRRRARPFPRAWQTHLGTLSARAGLSRAPGLAASDEVDTPVVLGWLRPVIVFPVAALTGLTTAQCEAILLHELMHVRRRDYLINVLQSAVTTVLFFHPAVWWVSRRIREEREHCCDDDVVALVRPIDYARALSQLETVRSNQATAAPCATGGHLMKRVERILPGASRTASGPRPPVRLVAGAAALILAAGVALAANVAEVRDARADEATIRWLPQPVAERMPVIARAARAHGLHPHLLAIFALVESRGDARARSHSGALGLFQLRPSTAAVIARERGIRGHVPARLLDPAYNADLGAWYLARQLERFEGRRDAIALAAAAYNAGPRRVQENLDDNRPLPTETRRYQRLIIDLWADRDRATSRAYEAWTADTP